MLKKILLFVSLLLSSVLYSQNLDIKILRAINSPEDLPSDKFFQFVSNSEPYIVASIPLGIGIAGLIKHDKKLQRDACVIIAATAINSIISTTLKYSINRERPFVTYPDITKKSPAGSPSFPSGHTSSAFATATSLSIAYPKWYVIAPSYLWAGTVGYSRMHLGVHYPSDVLCGAIIGTGSSFLAYKADKWINNRNKKKHTINKDI